MFVLQNTPTQHPSDRKMSRHSEQLSSVTRKYPKYLVVVDTKCSGQRAVSQNAPLCLVPLFAYFHRPLPDTSITTVWTVLV